MKHFFLYTIAFLACLSCSTKQKVTVEYKDYRPLNMSSFITLQKNILLDTPTEEKRTIEDFLHIGRLLFAQDKLYVMDDRGNKILMFDDEGKFLKSIGGAAGEVSGNRLKIQDAALDAQSQKLYAYCSTTCQIMVFDLDLNVEKTIPMVTPFLEIGLDGNCLYAIRTSLKRDGCELVVFDKNRLEDAPSVLWKQASIPSGKQTSGETFILPGKSLSPSEDGTYASLPQSNRICQIRNGKITATYNLDFDGQAPQSASYNIYNICASDSFLIFNTDSSKSWFILNRKTGKCIVDENLRNDVCLGQNSRLIPVQGKDNGLAYDMPAVVVSQTLQHLKKHKEEFEQFDQMKLYRPYLPFLEKDIAPQDNPMLYLWEIR
ncbi:6-bladed beta-propeller [Paraprevotella xylaniphila]|uniref:6-bladed beta-propeller n=1 Tax=Paraprevotella xylaniphila TaxID=454155 RepID=UPI003AB9120E